MEYLQEHNMRFPHPSTHLCVGGSGAGKTFRACQIIRYKDEMIENGHNISNVVFFYSVWQQLYQDMYDEGLVQIWENKIPTNEDFIEKVSPYKDTGGSLVIVDDYEGSIGNDFDEIMRVTSRHYNASCMMLFQSLFPQKKQARQISLNAKFLHIHKNPRDNAQFRFLARQLRPDSYKWLIKAYEFATQEPFSAMLIDLHQNRLNILRFRSHYLPYEFPMRVYHQKGVYV